MNDDNSGRVVIIHRLSYTTIASPCEGQPPVAQLAVRSRPSTSDPVQSFSEWRLIQHYTSESSRQQYSYSITVHALCSGVTLLHVFVFIFVYPTSFFKLLSFGNKKNAGSPLKNQQRSSIYSVWCLWISYDWRIYIDCYYCLMKTSPLLPLLSSYLLVVVYK